MNRHRTMNILQNALLATVKPQELKGDEYEWEVEQH